MSIQAQNEAIMKEWFEGGVWGASDDASAEAFIDAHYAEDGRAYGLGDSFVEGPAHFKQFRTAMAAAFPKQVFEVTHIHAHDDQVWLRWEATLTSAGGETYSLIGGGLLEMADGKIVKAWNLVNFLDMLESMGTVDAGSLVKGFETLAAKSN